MDRFSWLDDSTLRVETYRSGFFTFQTGLDIPALQGLLDRVSDAQQRFGGIPYLSQISAALEKEVIAASVFGTNTIEGGDLTEEETARILLLDPEQVQREADRRVVNIKAAYDAAKRAAAESRQAHEQWLFSPETAKRLHVLISQGLTAEYNPPGEYRDNAKGQPTYVGDEAHGGRYRPPKCRDDVELLMEALAAWINCPAVLALPPLIRASLLHLYFELIHPFWNGNGRTGRVLEALVLQASGFVYAPFAMANYYLEHIHAYFTLFNQARKAAEGKEPAPHQSFVEFFLSGMLGVINRLHDRVNGMIAALIYSFRLTQARDEKVLNGRQYAVARQLLELGRPVPREELAAMAWYRAMYLRLSGKTAQRDLAGLVGKGFLREGERGLGVAG